MAAVLIGLAIVAPTAEQISVWIGFCLVLNACAMFNDVATDGLTIDLVPHEERPTINGFMIAAHWIGIVVSRVAAGQLLGADQIGLLGVVLAGVVALARHIAGYDSLATPSQRRRLTR